MRFAVPARTLLRPGTAATAVTLVAVVGCGSGGMSAGDREARGAAFATAVSAAKLATTPPEALARDVANSLDGLLPKLSAPELHSPAVEVHQDLHRIEKFARRGDTARADSAASAAREHLQELATACELPVERFLEPGT